MVKVYCITGYPKTGKSEFIKRLKGVADCEVYEKSIIDFAKQIVYDTIGELPKNDLYRQLLEGILNTFNGYHDFPVYNIIRETQELKKELDNDNKDGIIIVNIRNKKFRKIFSTLCNAKTILMNRNNIDIETLSTEEDKKCCELYEGEEENLINVYNNGTLENLENEARNFIERYMYERD